MRGRLLEGEGGDTSRTEILSAKKMLFKVFSDGKFDEEADNGIF